MLNNHNKFFCGTAKQQYSFGNDSIYINISNNHFINEKFNTISKLHTDKNNDFFKFKIKIKKMFQIL